MFHLALIGLQTPSAYPLPQNRSHIQPALTSARQAGNLRELTYLEVGTWAMDGGSRLGTNRSQPTDVHQIIATIKKYKICGMIVIGKWCSQTVACACCRAFCGPGSYVAGQAVGFHGRGESLWSRSF